MIPLLQLDDVTYDELTQQALESLPKLCQGWTDYNASDPGIALIEMFAWLVEMVIYQTNQITPDSQWNFLDLINGTSWKHEGDLQTAIYQTVTLLRTPDRAVTTSDYVYLVKNLFPAATLDPAGTAAQIGPVRCLGETALGWTPPSSSSSSSSAPSASSGEQAPPPVAKGHVSVVIVPTTLRVPSAPPPAPSSSSSTMMLTSRSWRQAVGFAAIESSSSGSELPSSSSLSSSSSGDQPWVPSPQLLQGAYDYLFLRRMLTTQLHVVGPRVAILRVTASLFLDDNASTSGVLDAATAAMVDYLNPLSGGPDRLGWPFDRNLYPSDLYTLLQDLDGVSFVYVAADDSRIWGLDVTQIPPLQIDIIGVAGPVDFPLGPVDSVSLSCFDVLWLTSDNCRLNIYQPIGTPVGNSFIQAYP